jgi:hypothetical protein
MTTLRVQNGGHSTQGRNQGNRRMMRLTGLMVGFIHARGPRACGKLAFYAPVSVFETEAPLAVVMGGVAERINLRHEAPCAGCGGRVWRDDLQTEVSSLPQLYIAPERRTRPRGRGLRPLRDQVGPVSLGQIAAAIGVPRKKLREMCEGGSVPGAYRHHGKRREWRVPMKEARAFIALLIGTVTAAA